MKIKLLFITLLLSTLGFAQSKGTISGTITDKDLNNETLPFATITVKGTTNSKQTDIDGKYSIDVNPGSYVLVYSFLGYESQEEKITIVAGEKKTINKALSSGSVTLEDVVIESIQSREKETALLLEQQKSVTITQNIGAQELTRKGVSDAAAAVTKVTGISRQDGTSGIFVRGLGDRYNSTTFNGLPLPSNDPSNKNVALDLFSTDVIQSVGVSKTYYPDLYGDVGGANINIVSKEHNGKGKLNIEIGSGLNNNAFGSDFKVADGIEKSGFYNVNKPTNITNVYQFKNKWVPKSEGSPVDTNIGISGGNSFDIGENGRLSLFATASFENGYNLKKGSQRNIGNRNDLVIEDYYDVDKYEYVTKSTGMLNLAYKINSNHSIKWNSVFVNSSKSDVNEFYFINENGSESFTRQTVAEQNKLFVNQLLGKSEISERLALNWGGSYGMVNSDMPDRITNTLVEGNNGYVFNSNTQSSNNRYFQELEENEIAAKAVFDFKVFKGSSEDYKGKFSFGYNGRIKSRDFEATQFNFRINGTVPTTENTIDDFLNADNQSNSTVVNNTFKILTSRNAGSLRPFTYNADLSIHSGLANFEYSPSEKFTYTIGVRAEKVLQEMEWDTNISLPNVNFDDAKIDKTYILPVATLKYALNDKQNLRVAASKTYTLPQFIEKAPFRFEVVGESTVGNAFLNPSDNYNFDLKWEFFPSNDELISITGFGKYIIDPISKVRLNSALNDNTFVNAGDNAIVAGVEFEIRKNLWNVEDRSNLSAGFNFTYMYSEQKLDSEKVAQETNNTISVSFNDSKDGLQGASPLLVNADLTYRIEAGAFKPTISLVGNYFHDRIYSLGNIQTGGNVMEKGIATLNFISSAAIGDRLNVNFNVKNLLDAKIERYRENSDGDATIYSYKTGLDFSLGIKYSLF